MKRRITWIASYPKSGNTWVRALLLQYLSPSGTAAVLKDLKAIPIASSRQLFDQALGCESDLLLPDEIPALQCAWYDLVAQRHPGHFFKVHEQYNPQLHTPANSSLVLYIIRNPWDVAVSYAAHRGSPIADIIPTLEDDHYIAALSITERKPQLPQLYGSWSGHVDSWLNQSAIPVHVTRYEDLLTNPHPTFAALLQACGYPIDETRLHAAIAACSFQNLRAQEDTAGFPEKPTTSEKFFRQGRVGGWREVLTADQATRIAQQHAATITRWGYTQ
jgi:aryl sulfotransferase